MGGILGLSRLAQELLPIDARPRTFGLLSTTLRFFV
jgi:hypothetical protein